MPERSLGGSVDRSGRAHPRQGAPGRTLADRGAGTGRRRSLGRRRVVIADGGDPARPDRGRRPHQIREYATHRPQQHRPDSVIAHAAEFQGDHLRARLSLPPDGDLRRARRLRRHRRRHGLRHAAFDDGQQSQRIGGRRETPNDHASACIVGAYSAPASTSRCYPASRSAATARSDPASSSRRTCLRELLWS